MTTLYDLFPKKNGMYADELTYDVSAGCYILLRFDPDDDEEFTEYHIFRRDIREAKQAYDRETEDVKKKTAFISSIFENCITWISDEDFDGCTRTYASNIYNAIANPNLNCLIFFGLSTEENHIDLDEADIFIEVLTKGFREGREWGDPKRIERSWMKKLTVL